jgi:DNA-directed RNA polymerase specialized sigma24 family protein
MAQYPVNPGPTRWSVIVEAQGAGTKAQAALGELIRRYENFVTMLIRCRPHPPDVSAEELKQEFFAQVLKRGDIAKLDKTLGTFRGFLRRAVRYFVGNEWGRWRALKYGRGVTDPSTFDLAPDTTEDLLCNAMFARDTLQHVLERLEAEAPDKARFAALKRFLPGPQLDLVEHEVLAQSLGMTVVALKTAISRLRARYKELLHGAIADTLPTDPSDPTFPQAVADETRLLYRSLYETPSFEVLLADA